MNKRVWLCAALLVSLPLARVAAADAGTKEIKDTAELFPAQTLAYLEVRQPARLSREITALFKGTALENLQETLADFRAKHDNERDNLWGMYAFMELGLFLSPEMINEFGRLQGGAVALTGFNPDEGPEIVGVILNGESNLPTFIMRAYLTGDFEVRKIGACEGVALYRSKRSQFVKAPPGAAPPPVVKEDGPTYALLPNAIVIGSTTDSVKEVIKRMKGKNAEQPSLASTRAFKDASKQRDKPGLFGYASGPEIAAQIDKALKKDQDKGAGAELATSWLGMMRSMLNPEGFRTIAASWTLDNGVMELQIDAALDPSKPSPLADLLAGKKADAKLMHALPRDGQFAVAMSLSDGDKKMEDLLKVFDSAFKDGKESGDHNPRKIIESMEEKLKLNLAKDVLPKVTGVAISIGGGEGEKTPGPVFTFAVGAKDADAAQFLQEKALPKILGMIFFGGDNEPKITVETIRGQEIQHFAAGPMTLHGGRNGATVVFGTDAKLVAEGLNGLSKKSGLFGDEKIASAVKEVDDAQLIGVWSLSRGAVSMVNQMDGTGRVRPVRPGDPPAKPEPKAGEDPLTKDFLKATEGMPPTIISIKRKPDSLTVLARQPALKAIAGKTIDYIVQGGMERSLKGGNAIFEKVDPDLPPPPAPDK
jgi:hypothetical protein